MRRFKVNVGKRNRYFNTLEEARAFCNQVATKTGIILSIVEVR